MNAIILAAGTASRFVPLSEEIPKGLLEVKGEILVERQIRQLQAAGINDITVVLGYKAPSFYYLRDIFNVSIVLNEDYQRYNNTSSMIRVLDRLDETIICCSDQYFSDNPFMETSGDSYYASLYSNERTEEYCLTLDQDNWITDVRVGGEKAWYMAGHVFFNHLFSSKFREILAQEYLHDETRYCYWEDVYIKHIKVLPMKGKKFKDGSIKEFDSIDELRLFDFSYIEDTRSSIIRDLCAQLGCKESSLSGFKRVDLPDGHQSFSFLREGQRYLYDYRNKTVRGI